MAGIGAELPLPRGAAKRGVYPLGGWIRRWVCGVVIGRLPVRGNRDQVCHRVRRIFEYFEFEKEIEKMREANILYLVVSKFCDVDLHPEWASGPRDNDHPSSDTPSV
jgi:hypothetical protein